MKTVLTTIVTSTLLLRLRSIALALLALFSTTISFSQSIDWVVDGVSPNQNVTTAVYCDSDKVFVCGSFGSLFGSNGTTLQFSNAPILTSRGQSDAFVVSMNPDKTVNWVKQMGGEEWDRTGDVVSDNQGNVYVSGTFEDSMWIDNMHLVCQGLADIFFAKFDSVGNLLWLKQIKSTGTSYYPKLTTDNNGNVYVAGSFLSDTDFGDGIVHIFQGGSQFNFLRDAFLCKYDVNGDLVWSKVFQSPSTENVTSVVVAPTGEIYACGSFIDSLNFDGVMKTSLGEDDIFLVKYTADGSLIWVRTYGGTHGDIPSKISLYQQGRLFMTVTYEDSITMNGMPFNCVPWDANNLLLVKMDSSGEPTWAKSFAVELVEPVADINDSGEISFSGEFLINAFLDNFSLTSFEIGKFDVFVAMCDSSGAVNNVFQGGMGQLDEFMHDLDMDNSGNVYAVGGTPGSEIVWANNHVANSFFVLKITQEVEPATVSSSTIKGFRISPNPTSGKVSWSADEDTRTIEVYDMSGRLLINEQIGLKVSMDLSGLSAGVYLVQIRTSEGIYKQLVTKQ